MLDDKRKATATRAIFLLAIAVQFQEITALPPHIQISVCSLSCAAIATFSEHLQKY